jgi:hypothetical protein
MVSELLVPIQHFKREELEVQKVAPPALSPQPGSSHSQKALSRVKRQADGAGGNADSTSRFCLKKVPTGGNREPGLQGPSSPAIPTGAEKG